jgi:hypothetical protein
MFVWLKPFQNIVFPYGKKELLFTLAWRNDSFQQRMKNIDVICEGNILKFKRHRFAKKVQEVQVNLDYFIPSALDESSLDSRKLSYPVMSYRFN